MTATRISDSLPILHEEDQPLAVPLKHPVAARPLGYNDI
jgi:hypothetical protein